MLRLAIDTLALYASSCRFFVAITPPSLHCGWGTICNLDSYMQRGWYVACSCSVAGVVSVVVPSFLLPLLPPTQA